VLHFAQFLQQIPFCTTIELSSARAFPLLKNSHHGDAGLLSIPALVCFLKFLLLPPLLEFQSLEERLIRFSRPRMTQKNNG
jgi:hypothetical protein